jgi:low temperature requirement protein LtrA
MIYDLVATRVGSALGRGWRLPSAEHWAERHGLVVILALGESIVAIGVGVAREPIDLPIMLGAAASVVISVLLWWSYFARLAAFGERALSRVDGQARAILGADAYSYAHFEIIAGIIVTALGIEDAMKHVDDPESFGWFGAIALGAGIAMFAAGTVVFAALVGMRRPIMRAVEAVLLLAVIPALAAVPPLAALVITVTLMGVVALIESALHRPADAAHGREPESAESAP